MKSKERTYESCIFTPEVIKGSDAIFKSALPDSDTKLNLQRLAIELASGDKLEYDNEEEFFAGYRNGFNGANYWKEYSHMKSQTREVSLFTLTFDIYRNIYDIPRTKVFVRMPTNADIEKVFESLEANVEKCRIPLPPKQRRRRERRPKVKIFIGHGHDIQWKGLKDHLHEKQGFEVEHYEHGERAGQTIKEVLDEMLTESSFALLVLTAEDLDAEGKLHARENVIHELGLFQGRLGWRKAIALLEKGIEEFSNIQGINQIRFGKDNIQETYGDVVATIRREFSHKQ